MEMVIYNGIQYRPEDAVRLGIQHKIDTENAARSAAQDEEAAQDEGKAAAEEKAQEGSQNRARASGDGDKAERPARGRVRTKKEPNDVGDAAD